MKRSKIALICAGFLLLAAGLFLLQRDDVQQQIVQQERGEILEYVLTGESGPDHAKVFEIEARLNSNVIGHGRGRSKREAEQLAAKEALVLFGDK